MSLRVNQYNNQKNKNKQIIHFYYLFTFFLLTVLILEFDILFTNF